MKIIRLSSKESYYRMWFSLLDEFVPVFVIADVVKYEICYIPFSNFYDINGILIKNGGIWQIDQVDSNIIKSDCFILVPPWK